MKLFPFAGRFERVMKPLCAATREDKARRRFHSILPIQRLWKPSLVVGKALLVPVTLLGGLFFTAARFEPAGQAAQVREAASEKIDFARDVAPIFAASCYACHGEQQQQGKMRLDSKGALLKGGISGRVVIPGNSLASLLVKRLLGATDGPTMPLAADPLTTKQIDTVRAWIDQLDQDSEEKAGALVGESAVAGPGRFQRHWAYVKPVRPLIPRVNNIGWVRNPVDRFVLARLEKERLSPSPEASRETLVRRLSLDLIGLPPTVKEIDAFLADNSADGYEKLVDRILASPHFGERWARPWLDLARYADSNGYEKDNLRTIWKYRDWVIDALNRDMSWKQFTIEQIAGDMLPNSTPEQLIATGFHRNTLLNQEGGVDDEEARFYTLVDRVNTTATVWLGTTLECAQCHDHKYDPFTQRDYYKFMAFFDNGVYEILNLGQGEGWVAEPELELPTPEQEARSQEIRKEIAELEAVLNTSTPELEAAQVRWEEEMKGMDSYWTTLRPSEYTSVGGATLKLLDDGSILASGKNPEADTYVIQAQTELSGITGFRLEVLNDPSLPQGGPGRDSEGNFVLTDLEVETVPVNSRQKARKLVFRKAQANDWQKGYEITHLVQQSLYKKGWAIDASWAGAPLRRQAVLIPEEPFGSHPGTKLTIRLKHQMPRATRNIGRFRLALTSMSDPRRRVRVPARLWPVLDIPVARRTEEQSNALAAVFRSVIPLLQPTRGRLAELEKARKDLNIVTTLILRERPSFERPSTYFRSRGSFMSPAEKVYAEVPATLHPLPASQMPNRLGLAHWLVDEENPLTARVTVNRFWENIFGSGLVETSENLGTQGEQPTHPELLDWLAAEFMQQGWSMKKLLRLMVTSATYRQSSRVSPELRRRDPYNRLLARAPRFRVEAEMVRDTALAVSGLLSRKVGGPSVFPYQPEGVWDRPASAEKWVISQGEDQYRRGIYTFIRRTSPYPSMITFDAPSREICTARRVRTDTPLQALTTLNDRVFFESAQALARRILSESGPDARTRATYGFRLCTARRPAAQELNRIVAFYHLQFEKFRGDREAAQRVTGREDDRDGDMVALAAWTVVSNALLNLDETISKE